MESQPQNPELRNNPGKLLPMRYATSCRTRLHIYEKILMFSPKTLDFKVN